jgi:hypothetical protein
VVSAADPYGRNLGSLDRQQLSYRIKKLVYVINGQLCAFHGQLLTGSLCSLLSWGAAMLNSLIMQPQMGRLYVN